MRALLLITAWLLTGCTSITSVRGRSATALSTSDIQQIRRIAQQSPHFGHTAFILDVVQADRVHVRTREYDGSDWHGRNIYVIREGERWRVDEHAPIFGESERRVVTW